MNTWRKNLQQQGAPVPCKKERKMSDESKCPVMHGANSQAKAGAWTNADWWPNQLNLKILHQHSSLSDPMEKDFR
jgi:catalase (peroxidase I)